MPGPNAMRYLMELKKEARKRKEEQEKEEMKKIASKEENLIEDRFEILDL